MGRAGASATPSASYHWPPTRFEVGPDALAVRTVAAAVRIEREKCMSTGGERKVECELLSSDLPST